MCKYVYDAQREQLHRITDKRLIGKVRPRRALILWLSVGRTHTAVHDTLEQTSACARTHKKDVEIEGSRR